MNTLPTLYTERLLLRPLKVTDAPIVQNLAGKREIAETTIAIPHPYEDGMAEEWIKSHQKINDQSREYPFAITIKEGRTKGALIGIVAIIPRRPHKKAEIGYWIGLPYWSQGYCTEAAARIVAFGFEEFEYQRMYAHCFSRNIASARVLEKIGMTREGCLRQDIYKWDRFEDIYIYSILRHEYEVMNK